MKNVWSLLVFVLAISFPLNAQHNKVLLARDFAWYAAYFNSVDDTIAVDPLIPPGSWPWFCLDGIEYQGKTISIIYDQDGNKYKMDPGLTILVDGEKVAHGKTLDPLEIALDQVLNHKN